MSYRTFFFCTSSYIQQKEYLLQCTNIAYDIIQNVLLNEIKEMPSVTRKSALVYLLDES
jgi:hypothetical protein